MTLERHVFDFVDNLFVGIRIILHDGENLVIEGCVRGEASVRPHITDVFVMRRVVE